MTRARLDYTLGLDYHPIIGSPNDGILTLGGWAIPNPLFFMGSSVDPNERVAIFIDGSNFYHGLKAAFGITRIDFRQLSLALCQGRKLVRTYYYNAPVIKQDDEARYRRQQQFFEVLYKTPYLTVHLGRLEKRPDGKIVEKGVDIKIASDMLRLAYSDAYDTAILVSADGDYVDAVEGVKERGKHVENAYFNRGSSYHLRKACDRFVEITQDIINTVKLPT